MSGYTVVQVEKAGVSVTKRVQVIGQYPFTAMFKLNKAYIAVNKVLLKILKIFLMLTVDSIRMSLILTKSLIYFLKNLTIF
ncbi:hypothetical protein ASG65_14885 [Bacillus sp. Leaf13]|nr:hypothetical protein ASG65_14885 [Bacillus sp. Leaf13]